MSADRPAPTVLVIRDGWGQNPHPEHNDFNAIHRAATPVADQLGVEWPTTLIRTSGEDAGLPVGTMGNSEVGHQNIGAGRVVDQEIMRIARSIREQHFFANPALLGAFEHARATGGAVHLLGLVSDGLVHSDITHLFALLDLAARLDWPSHRLNIHAITDGRDTAPSTGIGFIDQLEDEIARIGRGRIATITGRFWAMDRDHRWGRVARAYGALTGRTVSHKGSTDLTTRRAASARAALTQYYDQPLDDSRQGDEFVLPTVVGASEAGSKGRIGDGDAVIFFNFRGDRPRELCRALLLEDDAWDQVQNGGFDRGEQLHNLHLVSMTNYEKGLPVTAVAFDKPPKMPSILGQVIADAGLTQLRCAETEKYPHVTFFFNDYRDGPFPGEHRALLQSPTDVATYDQKPAMSALAVRDAVLERLRADDAESLIVVNFANADMVGHTGKLDAIVAAVETVDACVGALLEATLARGGNLIITADHGNAEQTWNLEHDCPHTAHTTYDVPLHLVAPAFRGQSLRGDGRLADLAPTLLAVMGLPHPAAMTGRSLLLKTET